MPPWAEHRNPQGRPYWYNAATQQSVWEKPQELKSPLELALSELGWKQYESNGRAYYVSDATKETTWEIPSDVKHKADRAAANIKVHSPAPAPASASSLQPPPAAAATAAALSNGAAGSPLPESAMQVAAPGQFGPGGGAYPGAPSALAQQQTQQVDLDFRNKDEAEQAFFGMLRNHNVTPSWTWEQVLRTTVTDPYFKALRTLGERKEAFEKYCQETKRRERENKEKSMDRNRPAWRTALGRLSEGDYGMKSWWSWERASRAIREAVPDVWQMSRHDEEREALWREYMDEMHRKEQKRQQEIRQGNIEKLGEILKTLNLDLAIRYNEASNMVKDTKDWKEDPDLQSIEPLDFLIVYEENVKRSEQEQSQSKHKQKVERQRQIRKNREAYLALLDELKQQGKITAGTKWKEVYPLLQNEDRFVDMLSNPGSTPMELFWDVVDDLDYKIEEDSRIIENVLSERTGGNFKVTPETKFEEFDEKVNDHVRVKNIKLEDRKAVFKGLLDRLATQAREERRRAERRLRHATEDLRYALKKLDPPIDTETAYVDAVSRFSDLPEYRDLEGHEEARRTAYEKYIARLREKKFEDEQEEKRRKEKEEEEEGAAKQREKEREQDAHMSDAGSATSRRRRHASRTATDTGRGTPKRDSLAVPAAGNDASPARSEHRSSSRRERERAESPPTGLKSRRASSRDGREEDRSERRDRERRDKDRSDRDRDRDRERESRSSRSHLERERGYEDEEDDRRSSKRRSSRRDDDAAEDRESSSVRRRSSRRDGGDEEGAESRRDRDSREERRSTRRREVEGDGYKELNGEKEAKRQKMEVDEPVIHAANTAAEGNEEDDGDKEEGEI